DAPGLAEAQQAGFLVGVEIAPALPALRLAHRADDRPQRVGCGFGLGQPARRRMLERAQLLVALARGDVLADAAVALEAARGIEHRLAADADPELLAGIVEPAQLEVLERLARF